MSDSDSDDDGANVNWETCYGKQNENVVSFVMAGGGSHWWNYVIKSCTPEFYTIYRLDSTGEHFIQDSSTHVFLFKNSNYDGESVTVVTIDEADILCEADEAAEITRFDTAYKELKT